MDREKDRESENEKQREEVDVLDLMNVIRILIMFFVLSYPYTWIESMHALSVLAFPPLPNCCSYNHVNDRTIMLFVAHALQLKPSNFHF